MLLQNLVSFMDAKQFKDMNLAFNDLHFGVNDTMLHLGASFGLNPHDLLKIIHDKKNKINQTQVIEFLNNGLLSPDYISHFHRLKNIGFNFHEICVLSTRSPSLSAKDIIHYNERQLYKAIGFTSNLEIRDWIDLAISPKHIIPFLKIGFTLLQDKQKLKNFIRANITPNEVFSFFKIGIQTEGEILNLKNFEISAEQIAPFLYIGYQLPLTPQCDVLKFIQNKISAKYVFYLKKIGVHSFQNIYNYYTNFMTVDEISAYKNIGFVNDDEILTYAKNFKIFPNEISPFVKIGYYPWDRIILTYIEKNISAEQVLSYKKVGISQDADILKTIKNGIKPTQITSFINMQKYFQQNQCFIQ